MTSFFVRAVIVLNTIGNAVGRALLAPLSWLPETAGALLASIATGVMLLWIFKWTSNQAAIKSVRNRMKAELLAQSLFTDEIGVVLRSQVAIIGYALRSVLFTIVPMLVMFIPISLLLAQLSLWWQARPLRVNDDAVVTLNLKGDAVSAWPDVRLEPNPAIETTVGPVRVLSQRAVCWNIKAKEPGYHRLVFVVDGKPIEKDLSIGRGLMRVSVKRPDWNLGELFLHPAELPVPEQSAAKSIEIQYPFSDSWMTGRDRWFICWMIVSGVAALIFSRMMKVEI